MNDLLNVLLIIIHIILFRHVLTHHVYSDTVDCTEVL